MPALSTRMFISGALRFGFFLLLILAGNAGAVTDLEQRQPLQLLATRIKQAVDQASAGVAPISVAVSQFERELNYLRNASINTTSATETKRHSIELLFAKLKYLAAHPELQNAANERPLLASGSNARATIDIETVASGHGDACAAALGIAQSLPVQLSLAQAGQGKNDAWFRFEPASTGHARFTTDSSGADPAIEVFSSCDDGAMAIAANDDDIGLDAAVAVATTAHKPLLLHVTNSGPAGQLKIAVADANGTISGTITDLATGLPVPNAAVLLFNSTQNYYYSQTSTDQNGLYSITVAPGTYYVSASTNEYVQQLYPAALCSAGSYYYSLNGCAVAQAQTVALTSGGSVTNINLALTHGQHILGQIRDSANQPLVATLTLFDAAGTSIENIYTDNVGHYSISTLPPGNYKLSARANGHGSQLYDHRACSGPLQAQCDPALGSTITVTNQDIYGVDFSLPVLAAIQGTVAATTQLDKYSPVVVVVDQYGGTLLTAYVDTTGHYVAGPLAPGTYFAYASTSGNFLQLFNGIDCNSDCSQNLATATPINITQSGQQVQVDFHLTPLPTTHGHVQDASNGLPLANVSILVSATPPSSFSTAASTMTDTNGDYTLSGILPGVYYVWALSNNHIDQIYPAIACEGVAGPYYWNSPNATCDVSSATLLKIALGITPPVMNFALAHSSAITGAAFVNAGSGSDLPASVEIDVYNGAGLVVARANTDTLGHYDFEDLVPGTAYVLAKGNNYNQQYVSQIWQQLDCPVSCIPTTGSAIVVGQNATVGNINFPLTRRDAVVGRVTGPQGAPISGALVDVFAATHSSYLGSGVSDSQGYYVAQANIGYSYYLGTESGAGYVDQVYSGVSCPNGSAYFNLCALTSGTSIAMGSNSTVPHIANFVLQRADKVFHNGFE